VRRTTLLDAASSRAADLTSALETERARTAEAQRETADMRQLLLRVYTGLNDPGLPLGQSDRSRATAGIGPLNSTTISGPRTAASMPPLAVATPVRNQFPVVDNVRRRLARLADLEQVRSIVW
jgi:hypothetical protein